MSNETPSLVGQVLGGRYRLNKKLGEGGMGEVYAGEHVHIDKKFAIKLLRPEIVSNKEAVKRFYQEAQSSSSIKHRNIIAIEDFGELPDGRIYMCMELLDGAALNDLIMQPQTVERLLNILIQTGHGLAAAHAKNIVHRDMKPENIYVTFGPNREDIPKILDFGIAKVSGNDAQNNLTRTGTIFGTPFYMAPEQALGNPVDARTDVYAMGVIMYEVFSGSLPFQGESFMGILTQHITTEPEPVQMRAAKAGRSLPPGLAEIVMCCLRKDPAQRFSTMDELVNQLVGIYRGIAGAGMSSYMEAFPVSSAHPIVTPGPMTGMVAAHSNTIGAMGPPPGVMPSGGHQVMHTPQGGVPPVAASQSGLYSGSSSAVVIPKKSNAGLIIAIFAVLAVGGAITAFVVLGQKNDGGTGSGSGSQVAEIGSGSAGSAVTPVNGSGSSVPPNNGGSGSSVTTNNGGSGSSATPNNGGSGSSITPNNGGSGSDTTPPPDAGTNVATVGIDAGSEPPPPIDAGGVEAKNVMVLLVAKNASSFEVWENGKKLFDGPDTLEVPDGGERKVVIKAKGFKDKEMTFSSKDRKPPKFSLTKIPVVNTNTNTNTNTKPKCSNTKADIQLSFCKAAYCASHTDKESQNLCNME